VATNRPWLMRGLDPELKYARAANYIVALRAELLSLSRACGVRHPALIDPDRIEQLRKGVDRTRELTAEELTELYAESYGNAPFVRILPAGQIPELKSVVNTPYAEIGFQLLQGGRRAVVVSVIVVVRMIITLNCKSLGACAHASSDIHHVAS